MESLQLVGWHTDLGYGGPQEGRMNLLEEVSRLLNAYAKAIWLGSDSEVRQENVHDS